MRRPLVLISVAAGTLLAAATTAWAHVELEPTEAVAGSTTTLTFSFHHGKDATATNALEVQLPDGTEVLEIGDAPGFFTSQSGTRIVRWDGGSVPDGVEARFPVTVILPNTPGVALFPTIQETEAGDLSWISPDEEEGEGDTGPAPRVTLTPNPSATTSTSEATTTTPSSSTTVDLPDTTVEAANEGDGDSAAPWLIGAGIAAVVAIAVGGTLLKRHSDRAEADAGEDDGTGAT